MYGIPAEKVAAGTFGLIFIVTMIVLAIRFPNPTPFQYTTFRVILALAAAGIAPFIPGLLEVQVSTAVKAGGAIAVFVIVYFFSPAKLVTTSTAVDLPALVKAWQGIRAPGSPPIDADMAHRALNAMNLVEWYWSKGSSSEKRLIKDEAFGPYEQWFSVLDANPIQISDGRSSREHLNGKLRTAYTEMKAYV
jgi:hypothetical protein